MNPPRLLVTGSRTWDDVDCIVDALERYWNCYGVAILISGNCPNGADDIAEHEAAELGYVLELYPANWNRYGKRAGFIRNAAMVAAKPTHCMAFIRNNSPGATHCLELAKAAGIPTRVWHVTDT